MASLVAVGPQLIGITPVRNWLLTRATAGLPVAVQLESARLRWWGPVEITGLAVTADDAPLTRVASIRSELPLWQLAWSPSRLGTWTIEGAELEVTLRPGGSNWEDLLARMPVTEAAKTSATPVLPAAAVALRESTVRIKALDQGSVPGRERTTPRDPGSQAEQAVVMDHLTADIVLQGTGAVAARSDDSTPAEAVPAGSAAKLLTFSCSGQVQGAPLEPARPHWRLDGSVPSEMAEGSSGDVESTLQLAGLPLRLVNPLATRLGIPLQAEGSVEGTVRAQLKQDAAGARVWRLEPSTADLQVQGLAVRSAWWRDETIASQQTRLQVNCSWDGTCLAVSRGELLTDWMDTTLQGSMDLTRLAVANSPANWPSVFSDLTTRGTVKVAPVASQLPRTLGLREGMAWSDGQVAWEVRQEAIEGGDQIVGNVSIDGLAAVQGSERYALRDPLRAEFRWNQPAVAVSQPAMLQRSASGRLEHLAVQSAFISLQGQGDLTQGQLQGRADLGLLTRELRQFVELGDQQGGGQLELQVNWQDAGDGLWQATARVNGNQLQWSSGSTVLWSENSLQLQGGLQARLEGDSRPAINAIESGELHLVAGQDRLDAVLQQPVRGPWSDAQVSLDAKLSGQLANWQNRLRPFIAWEDWQLRGELQSQATLVVSPRQFHVRSSQLQLRQATVAKGPQQWHEPAVQLQMQGSYDLERGQLDCPQLTLASTSVSLKADHLAWPLVVDSQAAARPATQLQYRGDLARIWQHLSSTSTARPRGQFAGRMQLAPTAGSWSLSTATRLQDFQWETLPNATPAARGGTAAAAGQAQLLWQEPVIDLNVEGQWLMAEQTARLQRAQLITSAAQVQLQGDLQLQGSPVVARLQGTTRFDLDQLTARLKPLYGDQIRLTGAVDRPFSLSGPLPVASPPAVAVPAGSATGAAATQLVSRTPANIGAQTPVSSPSVSAWISPELQAEAGLGWQSAHAFGFDLSAASIDARLQQQTVAIQPLDLQLSGGKMHLEPRLQLQGVPTLELPPGRVLEQVTITPAMCKGWLKYVAPLVADAAAAEGRFSADVRQLSVPLLNPDASRVQGTLGIHAARIGPGPLAAELLTLLAQVRAILDGQPPGSAPNAQAQAAWITFPEQQVPVRMEGGRVAHEGLTMLLGDVPVRTQGWVSVDNQLSLVAEVPIQESWVRDQRWLAGLKGQTLRIPVRGTVQRPQLDRSVLQQLGQTAVRGAAQGLLQDEVQRQMNKLLPDLLQGGAPRSK